MNEILSFGGVFTEKSPLILKLREMKQIFSNIKKMITNLRII